MSKVKFIITDHTNEESKSICEYFSTRQILEKSTMFNNWFKSIDHYQDFLEIGDAGYSGLSNLMLFKNGEDSYTFIINCHRYEHYFAKKVNGQYLIKYILDFLS